MNPEKFADAVVDLLKRIIAGPTIGGRFAALEARIVALEGRPLQKWAGTYVQGVRYAEGSLATRNGSLWAATTSRCISAPNSAPSVRRAAPRWRDISSTERK